MQSKVLVGKVYSVTTVALDAIPDSDSPLCKRQHKDPLHTILSGISASGKGPTLVVDQNGSTIETRLQ